MLRHRTARALVVVFLATAGTILGSSAEAAPTAAVVKPITFPVDGPTSYTDTFGAPRSGGRTHEGQDLMGAKMTREVAAVSGVVLRLTFDNLSAGGSSVVIRGDDGWTYHYLHVNNDTPGTDDGKATRAQAFPANVVVGARVSAGQLVAYMGDSGNAESSGSHLHFEIRQPAAPGAYIGVAINPYASLKAAEGGGTTSSSSRWLLRRSATGGPAEETFTYGLQVGDRGLLCDWDADGTDEAVIYRGGVWHLKNGTATGTTAGHITFGTSADTPLCGDVDGDGRDEPVLFAAGGRWTVRAGFGPADSVAWTVRYGLQAGDRPVLGDWDRDGDEDLAIFRAPEWHIRSTGTPAGATTARFRYGLQPGDLPVAGDWDGDGDDDAAIYRQGQWHLRSTASTTGATIRTFSFGSPGDQPVVGYGTDPSRPGIGVFDPKT